MNFHGISTMTPLARMQAANQPVSTNPSAPTSSTGSTSSAANQAASDAQDTFISLLITELQAQDPTQPMDPTQMVGQMFSMNQLQQLIDINQTLSAAFPAATGSKSTSGTSTPQPTPTGAH